MMVTIARMVWMGRWMGRWMSVMIYSVLHDACVNRCVSSMSAHTLRAAANGTCASGRRHRLRHTAGHCGYEESYQTNKKQAKMCKTSKHVDAALD